MSWKFIFNTNYIGAGTNIAKARELVKSSGYKFYNWNGVIYTIEGIDTGIKTDDCF